MSRRPSRREASELGESIADTLESVAEFHLEHYRQASPLQRAVDWLTEHVGRPPTLIVMLVVVTGWVAFAVWSSDGGIGTPAFAWLSLTGTLMALVLSALILVTQRREDQLAERRAKLTLELALLADKKTSKLIALIEELRRDHPEVANRVDRETDEMSEPVDAQAVIAAIDESTAAKNGA